MSTAPGVLTARAREKHPETPEPRTAKMLMDSEIECPSQGRAKAGRDFRYLAGCPLQELDTDNHRRDGDNALMKVAMVMHP